MANLKTYAEMANKVYFVPDWSKAQVNGWETWTFGEGTENTTGGFHGCIYKKDNEVVIVFRGTDSKRDITADIELAIGICPRQASAAADLYQRAERIFEDATRIVLVGHSLGGGLAQIVSHWYKVPFVTFNAPPMGSTIQKTKINILLMPQKAFRSFMGTFKKGAEGYNYRLSGDIVSSRKTSLLGHYGQVRVFTSPAVHGSLEAHSMDKFLDFLSRSSDGIKDPFDH
jgi:putative lipase involved disintegration of autophagic bodies